MDFAIIDRIIREEECKLITGLSRSTRWRMEQKGRFPLRCQISPGCVGWKASELKKWFETAGPASVAA